MQCLPITLSGQYANLEPLTQVHLVDIQTAAADGELWKLFFTSVPSFDGTQQWLTLALEMQAQGKALPFVVRNKVTGKNRRCDEVLQYRACSSAFRNWLYLVC